MKGSVTSTVATVELTLTADEAMYLLAVCGRVVGPPASGYNVYSDLYDILDNSEPNLVDGARALGNGLRFGPK